MNLRGLGTTGLTVSELGFGCGNVGGLMIRGGPEERLKAVDRAIELGINYFDTAAGYGDGQSERNLGRVLKELNPEVYVGTKVRLAPGEMQDIKGAVVRSAEESLKRLDRQYVDVLFLHNPIALQRNTPEGSPSGEDVLGDVVEAFQGLQAQGKARYYGITGLGETEAVHKVIESGALQTVQVCYNLLNPSAGIPLPSGFNAQDFGRLINRAAERNMGVIAISVLAEGALTGVNERHPVALPSANAVASRYEYGEDVERARSFNLLVEEGYVEGLVEAALRFALSNAGISTALVGCSSLEHLETAVKYASRGPLPPEALDRLPEVWANFAAR